MTIDEKTKSYIKQVYYSNFNELAEELIRLLEGEVSVEQLSQYIAEAKTRDEKMHGDDLYKIFDIK